MIRFIFRPPAFHAIHLGLGLAAVLAILCSPSQAAAPVSSIEARIACQTAIDGVRWSNMLWPESNPTPKPPLADVLPPDAVRAKVHDQLRMEAALDGLYGIRIEDWQLQAELDRMAAATRAPEQLRALYTALGNDANRIADCLARPNLVRKVLASRYAFDAGIHATLRRQAEIESKRETATGRAPAANSREVTYLRDTPEPASTRIAGEHDDPAVFEVSLAAEEWDARLKRLTRAGAGPGRAAGSAGALRETEEAFVQETLQDVDADRMTVRVRTWPKTSFGDWWTAEAIRWPPVLRSTQTKALNLMPIRAQGSAAHFAKGGLDDTWRTEGVAAAGRNYHTAVWSGSEMIVWGGSTSEGLTASGGRYDPVTDTWRATSMVGAPSARANHSAVWTGSVMIVWGGYAVGESGSTNTGGVYNPATDTWTATAINLAPEKRELHTAVWAGDEMIVWGGDHGNTLLASGARYFPATDTWSSITPANAPSARRHHAAAWLKSGLQPDDYVMVIWGGALDTGNTVTNEGRRYDPETNTWLSTALIGAPAPRQYMATAATNHELFIWGGVGAELNALGDGARYDAITNTWSAVATSGAPSPRSFTAGVWTGTDIIVWGGTADGSVPVADGAIYHPATNMWSAMAPNLLPMPLKEFRVVWAGDTSNPAPTDAMIAWGGFGDGYDSGEGARYRPQGDTWTAVAGANVPEGRTHHTAVWTGWDMIVSGGVSGAGEVITVAERYEPSTASWNPKDIFIGPRMRDSAVWSGTEVIVWGGYDGATALGTGVRYNPLTSSTKPTANEGVPARYDHSAVWLGGQMIVWGGRDGNTLFDTGARYAPGGSWSLMAVNNQPSARYDHTAVVASGEMIVWGGRAGNDILGNGRRYSPGLNAWISINGDGMPSPRFDYSAISTGKDMIVWGGAGEGFQTYGDGARYSPAFDTWTALPMLGAPSARYQHTAVWSGEEMLVWGGYSGDDLGTGARYDLGDDLWTPITNNGAPSARRQHTAVWAGTEMLVWGGLSGSAAVNSLGAYSADVELPDPAVFRDGFE